VLRGVELLAQLGVPLSGGLLQRLCYSDEAGLLRRMTRVNSVECPLSILEEDNPQVRSRLLVE
jgi:hypothetical protein